MSAVQGDVALNVLFRGRLVSEGLDQAPKRCQRVGVEGIADPGIIDLAPDDPGVFQNPQVFRAFKRNEVEKPRCGRVRLPAGEGGDGRSGPAASGPLRIGAEPGRAKATGAKSGPEAGGTRRWRNTCTFGNPADNTPGYRRIQRARAGRPRRDPRKTTPGER